MAVAYLNATTCGRLDIIMPRSQVGWVRCVGDDGGWQAGAGRGCDCDDVLGKARARRVEQGRWWVRKSH